MRLTRKTWFYAVVIASVSLALSGFFTLMRFAPDFGAFRAIVILPGIFAMVRPSFLSLTPAATQQLGWFSRTAAANQLYAALFAELVLTLGTWLAAIAWRTTFLKAWDAGVTVSCLVFNLIITYFVVQIYLNRHAVSGQQ